MSKYAKAIMAFLAAVGVLAAALKDGHLSGDEIGAIATAFAGVVAVFQVPNIGSIKVADVSDAEDDLPVDPNLGD